MGACNIDHTHEDVVEKLKSQAGFLPELLVDEIRQFLKREHPQETLNELFHLLKKYDLVSTDEQVVKGKKLTMLIRGHRIKAGKKNR